MSQSEREKAGITPHKVVIVPYNPQWPAMAKEIATKLVRALGDNLLVAEHVGSTSVPGLAAKPVIDLIPIVKSMAVLDSQQEQLKALGFKWHGEFGIEGRRFCTLSNAAGERLVHLHCFETGAAAIERHLAFRDYLRVHADIAAVYEEEKRRAALLHPNDSLEYNTEKAAWVQQHEKEALKWYSTR